MWFATVLSLTSEDWCTGVCLPAALGADPGGCVRHHTPLLQAGYPSIARIHSMKEVICMRPQDDGEDLNLAPNSQRVRERLRGSKAELSWLMHTTYLSADTAGQTAKGMGEKEYKTMRDAETAQPTVDDREAQIASIEVRSSCSCDRERLDCHP